MLDIANKASPVGSTVFSVIALVVISLVVLAILRFYLPLRTTPAHYLVPIFFALWLPSVVVILVPIDLASSARTDDEATRGIWLPERVVVVAWRITYWLTFVLTWALLPILGEYSDAGYREPIERLRYSVRQNAQFMAISLGLGLVGFIYILISYEVKLSRAKDVAMALAYCWGLALAIYLMGHGLVSIPRRLVRNASVTGRLRRLQTKAPKVYERMEDSLVSLEEVEYQVSELIRRKTGSALEFRDWIEELQEMANIGESQSRPGTTDPNSRVIPTVITDKFLASLTRKLVNARHTRSRYSDEWAQLIQEAHEAQAIIDSAASKKLDFGDADPHASWWSRTKFLTPYTRYLLYFQILPVANFLLGVLCAVASASIVWSEVIKVAAPNLSLIRLTVVHHWSQGRAEVGFAGQTISTFWVCYMFAAALTSVTEVRVWRGRALVKRNTAYESAFWYAMQAARLSVPLSYNFLTFLSPDVYKKTIFFKFLGQSIVLTDIGRWFDRLFPAFILVPVLATIFGLYKKVKRIFVGLDVIEDEDENPTGYGTGSWREGRDLIDRELRGNSLLRRRDDGFSRLSTTAAGGTAGRSAPVLSIPAARNAATSPSPSRAASNANRAGPSSSSRGRVIDEPEDENIFSIIGHRMKNTIDTIETPKWMQDFGQGMKTPKWMGGAEDGEQSQEAERGRSSSDIRRWFGGDGHIRL